MGPIGVKKHLAPFLPSHPVVKIFLTSPFHIFRSFACIKQNQKIQRFTVHEISRWRRYLSLISHASLINSD